MARNPYFKDYSGEQNVIEDLSIEIIKTMGRDMLYIPREQYDQHVEFGEAQYKFTKSFPLEMYIASVAGFEGEGDIISKFGLEVRDKVTLVVSKKRFNQEIVERYDGITRPREGDLIYFPLSKGLFEINFVEHENPFYQAGKLYTYTLVCELTTLDDDEFTTGDTDIDSVVTETRTPVYQLSFTSNIAGNTASFYDGEVVYQVSGLTGTTAAYSLATAQAKNFKFYPSTKKMEIFGITGTFVYGGQQTIRGKDSGAEYYVSGITGTNIIVPITLNSAAAGDNESIKDDGDTLKIYDFTDIDPFSEGIY
jgi:hypothetical protein